ncbi:MAG: VOC family protein [Rubrivivax sp.]|nr:VOC family protein [Rubrivivax sp.]
MTPRVTGIGGIFFKARDAGALREWYRRHLGLDIESWGGTVFRWQHEGNPQGLGSTVWSIFEPGSTYFAPSTAPFMVNFRVSDLDAVLAMLREEGCAVDEKVERSEFGAFGWVMDPEGNRIELWQPPSGQ